MNFSFFISRRLNLKPDGQSGRSPGIAIAVAGVAIAIAVMIITLATVLGFKHAIEEKVEGFDSQLGITAVDFYGRTTPVDNIGVVTQLVEEACQPRLALVTPSSRLTGVMKTDNDFAGLSFKSLVDRTVPYNFIFSSIVSGEMPLFADSASVNQVVISRATALMLGLEPGDRVMAYFVGDDGVRTRRLTVAAVYKTSFSERDKLLCYVSPDFIGSLAQTQPSQAMSLEVNGLSLDNIQATRQAVQEKLNDAYAARIIDQTLNVTDVKQTGAVYFSWLELLDTNVAVIIILMTLIASFTLVSSLFILILERVKLIGLLKALGATDRQTRMIFIYMAMRIVTIGIVAGNAVALSFVFIQKFYHIIPLNPDAYYLSYVPVSLDPWHWLAVNVGAVAVAWLVLIVPSMIISRISPASTMRYE